MFYYYHVLPRRIIAAIAAWFSQEKTRAKITFNLDKRGANEMRLARLSVQRHFNRKYLVLDLRIGPKLSNNKRMIKSYTLAEWRIK